MTPLPVFGAAFAAGLFVGLLGLAGFWLLQKTSRQGDTQQSMQPRNSASWQMVPPPPGLHDPTDSLAPDLMPSEPATATPLAVQAPPRETQGSTEAKGDAKDKSIDAKDAKAGNIPDAPLPAAERTTASTGSGEATSTAEGAQDGNIKQWVGQQLEPIRAAQRDIVKSLNELLDMHGNTTDTNGQLMAKLDKLQVTVDRTLDLHKTDASVQIGEKVGKFQATMDQSIELHKTAAKTADKLAKDLHELTEVSGRRHAATEVATEGTQEQLRGLKRELEATYTSLRDHRSQLKEHVTESGKRRMDILQEISQMSTKLHNGFAGLSAMTRTSSSVITETKETTERTLEVAEKTLAAVRVSGPSPSEAEFLEAVGDTQKSLKDIKTAMDTLEDNLESLKSMVSAPTPRPPHAPVHVPAASSHSVPPPPPHAPNLLNLTTPASSGPGGSWGGSGPTAAVMLGNPHQILRMMASHAGDGSN